MTTVQDAAAVAGDRPGRFSRFHVALSSVFGLGFFPFMPATATTLVLASGVFVFLKEPSVVELPLIVVLVVIGILSSGEAEKKLGHDAGPIVLDEVCGFLVTVFSIERFEFSVITAAFVLFRFFDIVKPWPVKRSQHLPGGVGIVIDDVLAGVYANIVLRVMLASGIL